MKKSPFSQFLALSLAFIAFTVLMAPILRFAIGGDDLYWVLLMPANYDNSFVEATSQWLGHAYDFSTNQARTVALQGVERVSLAMIVMKLATLFSVSPNFIWGLLKLVWLGIVAGSLWLFLTVFKYRSTNGEATSLSLKTRLTLVTLLPALTATGFEVASVGYSNGWVYYPNLTYLPLAYYLLTTVVLLHVETLLRRNFKFWIVPTAVVLVAIAWGLNLSYEINALSVPFALAVLAIKPVRMGSGRLKGQGHKWLVALIFGGTYTAVFLWTRWQLAHMPCVASHTCYSGTVIDIRLTTVVKNFISAFPGSNFPWLLNADAGAIALPVVLIGISAAAILALLTIRQVGRLNSDAPQVADSSDPESRPLLQIAALMLMTAIGSAIITGITERAVSRLATPVTPYRSGPIITLALSVAVAATLVVLWGRFKSKVRLSKLAVASVALVVIGLTAGNFVINHAFTQKAVSKPATVLVGNIYEEISLGSLGKEADDRRCALLDLYDSSSQSNSNKDKVIRGAQEAFNLYHGTAFCTTGPKKYVDMSNLDGY